MTIPSYYYFLGYLSTSILFFIFPSILHRKNKIPSFLSQAISGHKILRIAHRGGPRISTQNTIQAFKKVIHVSDILEMDVCQTQDAILVVHHDQSLKRTCGIDKYVRDYNFDELPPIKDQIVIDFADNVTRTTNNQRIPMLESVFQIFQGVPMDIELKTPTQTAIKQFVRLLIKYQRIDNTICGIRNGRMKTLQKLCPEVPKFMPDWQVFKLLFFYYTGLLPFISLRFQTLQPPIFTNDYLQRKLQEGKGWKHIIKMKAYLNFIWIVNFTTKPLFWHLKRRGIAVLTWVCNNQEEYQRAIDLGVCGIMTDQPFELDKFLNKKAK